jgi:ABC-type uncharacterized transport system substrate-binding protein
MLALSSQSATAEKCLYISSYHKGYAWSDGVEQGLREAVGDKCELKQFDMDTKRNKDTTSIRSAALQAKKLVDSWQPDIVITSDDNAVKYVIQPFYKDHHIPFVFCGVNWTVEGYDLPYKNTTGMVEVAPIDELFRKVDAIQGRGRTAFYIGADTLTETKNLHRFELAAEKYNIDLKHRLVQTTKGWISAYKHAQLYDLVIIGSNSGINDWDSKLAKNIVQANTSKLSVTNHEWMMPFAIFGLTKIPAEHGEWAGKAALAILHGTSPTEIPIVSNRKSEIWVNESVLQGSGIEMPAAYLRKAKKVK